MTDVRGLLEWWEKTSLDPNLPAELDKLERAIKLTRKALGITKERSNGMAVATSPTALATAATNDDNTRLDQAITWINNRLEANYVAGTGKVEILITIQVPGPRVLKRIVQAYRDAGWATVQFVTNAQGETRLVLTSPSI